MTVVTFVLVAAVASVLRAALTAGQALTAIPYRTLAVNCGGAFALGLVLGSSWFDDPVIVATAGLGSLTTFSTVAAETAALIDNGRNRHAIAYVGLTLVVGVAAAWLGLTIGESL